MLKFNKMVFTATSNVVVLFLLVFEGFLLCNVVVFPIHETSVFAASSSYDAALSNGYFYAKHNHLSKHMIYKHLYFKNGTAFSKHAAMYAVNHIHGINWNHNALKIANFYRHKKHMCNKEIYHRLISKKGDMFTRSQARYAIHHL